MNGGRKAAAFPTLRFALRLVALTPCLSSAAAFAQNTAGAAPCIAPMTPATASFGPQPGPLGHHTIDASNLPGAPRNSVEPKGGSFPPAAPPPSPIMVEPGPTGIGNLPSADAVAAAGDVGGGDGNSDTLDGDACFLFHRPVGAANFPDGLPTTANYSLIGAQPFDLGAIQRGGAGVSAPTADGGAALVANALAGTPMASPHGYGPAFAIGSGGTVSPSSGAFAHPFTLLTLPGHAPRMGVYLRLQYLSNAVHPSFDPQPFGPGFVLSGHDFLEETSTGQQANEGAQTVVVHRGDGVSAEYSQLGCIVDAGKTTCTYSSTAGAFDVLRSEHTDAGGLKYIRRLQDGREITYGRPGSSGQRFRREKVRDEYGNTIQYTWNDVAGSGGNVAHLLSITDARGLVVWFAWETPSGMAPRVKGVFLDTTSGVFEPGEPSDWPD